MLNINQIRIRDVVVSWFKRITWVEPYSVTLTMSRKVLRDNSQNFRHFMNRLNRKYLKKSFIRYGNKLKVIPVIEGDDVIEQHYHCIIDNPHKKSEEEFRELIRQSWIKTDLRRPVIHVEPMRDEHWIDYMMKYRSKKSISDSIDWMNVNI